MAQHRHLALAFGTSSRARQEVSVVRVKKYRFIPSEVKRLKGDYIFEQGAVLQQLLLGSFLYHSKRPFDPEDELVAHSDSVTVADVRALFEDQARMIAQEKGVEHKNIACRSTTVSMFSDIAAKASEYLQDLVFRGYLEETEKRENIYRASGLPEDIAEMVADLSLQTPMDLAVERMMRRGGVDEFRLADDGWKFYMARCVEMGCDDTNTETSVVGTGVARLILSKGTRAVEPCEWSSIEALHILFVAADPFVLPQPLVMHAIFNTVRISGDWMARFVTNPLLFFPYLRLVQISVPIQTSRRNHKHYLATFLGGPAAMPYVPDLVPTPSGN